MQKWIRDRDEDDPNGYRRVVYQMGPAERNGRPLRSEVEDPEEKPEQALEDQLHKAGAILAWESHELAEDRGHAKPEGDGSSQASLGTETIEGQANLAGGQATKGPEWEQKSSSDGDEDDDGKTYMGIGSGRRRALDAIEETPHLEPIETFDSVDEMADAIGDIHIRGYSSPPEDTIDKLRHYFGRLPDEQAEWNDLNDYKLTRSVNTARQAFNEWVGPKKRYGQIPGLMEERPPNYPSRSTTSVGTPSGREARSWTKSSTG